MMIERARIERGRGREVEVRGKRMWIDGKEWVWNEERERGDRRKKG